MENNIDRMKEDILVKAEPGGKRRVGNLKKR